MKAIEIINLEKHFFSNFLHRKQPVLKGINLSVDVGEIYGFLGPNGAGKTTTIKCLLGLLRPNAGQVSVMGNSSCSLESRNRMGFLPEQPYFYDYLTIEELLHFTCMLFRIPKENREKKITRVLKLVGLSGLQKVKLRKCSKGMIQRAGLGQALVQDPDILVLDEPFSGLDPVGRKELREVILSLKRSGRTIFFSSHILQDMELMVDRVGIIFSGEMVREGRLSEMADHSIQHYEVVFLGELPASFFTRGLVLTGQKRGNVCRAENEEKANRLIAEVLENNGRIVSVTPVNLSLEDIFLKEISR